MRLLPYSWLSLSTYNDTQLNYSKCTGLKLNKAEELVESPLTFACIKSNGVMVRLLLQHGADPNEYNKRGQTALHIAVRKDLIDIMTLLLGAGGDPYIRLGKDRTIMEVNSNKSAPTPAQWVFTDGSFEAVSIFVPHLRSAEWVTAALQWAILKQPVAIIDHILQHPAADVNAKFWKFGADDVTLLHVGCANRRLDSIVSLLKAGANTNIPAGPSSRSRTWSPLHCLSSYNYMDGPYHGETVKHHEADIRKCFAIIIQAGANINQTDYQGRTPLHVAKDSVAVECLLEHGADPNAVDRYGETLLHKTMDEEILEILFKHCDINQRGTYTDYTPLMAALRESTSFDGASVRKALRLITVGADVRVHDKHGNSALHFAASLPQSTEALVSLLEALVIKGADVNWRNNIGQTPIHMTRSGAGLNQVAFSALVKAGADTEVKDNDGKTILFDMVTSDPYHFTRDICEYMLGIGCRIDTCSSTGKTLLHAVIGRSLHDTKILKFLVSKGLDPRQTDHRGNTLLHEAGLYLSRRRESENVSSTLIDMGLDPEQENHDGQTVLHILCKFTPLAFMPGNSFNGQTGRGSDEDIPTSFDFFLDRGLDVNHRDKQGITPLHIASTFSEYMVRRLLEGGTDPCIATAEGLTVFHLSARSAVPNVIGVLLDWLILNMSQDELVSLLNTQDRLGRTALFYACVSGRVESVRLLVESGASIDTREFSGSPWDGCASFEEQDSGADVTFHHNQGQQHAGPVTISDRPRSETVDRNARDSSPFDLPRMNEILELLVSRAPSAATRYIDIAVSTAVAHKRDYCVETLITARSVLPSQAEYPLDKDTEGCLTRNREVGAWRDPQNRIEYTIPVLMQRRAYSALPNILANKSCLVFGISSYTGTILHHLVRGGFATLVSQVASKDDVAKAESREWWEEQQKKQRNNIGIYEPFVITACQRRLSNMEVLRVLVEEKEADPNARVMTGSRNTQSWVPKRGQPNSLHFLVKGNHWWQITKALPYLVGKGADLESRNESGHTPLLWVLEAVNGPNFNMKAVKMLLKLGADSNATDTRGQSCLAKAGSNQEVFRLLMSHGATITPAAMIATIKCKEFDRLEMLLKSGADPNMREVRKEVPAASQYGIHRPGSTDPNSADEMYAIDYTATIAGRPEKDMEEYMKFFKLLLDYGADLTGRYKTTTVAHRMIRNMPMPDTIHSGENGFLRTLLGYPKLELEVRDANGMTLLLIACQQVSSHNNAVAGSSIVRLLLDRGANSEAVDHENRNALHHLLRGDAFAFPKQISLEDLQYIATRCPMLVNAGDNNGETPLHYSLKNMGDASKILLSAGADVCQADAQGNTPLHILLGGSWGVNAHDVVGRRALAEFDSTKLQNIP
jgi:ankyrin repeat protein